MNQGKEKGGRNEKKKGEKRKEGRKEVKRRNKGMKKRKEGGKKRGKRKEAGIVEKGTRRDKRTGGLRNEQYYEYIKIDMRVNQDKLFSIYVTMLRTIWTRQNLADLRAGGGDKAIFLVLLSLFSML